MRFDKSVVPTKVLAVIQARMGSTRLPGKSLLKLAGVPVVEHVARRTCESLFVQRVVFAIPVSSEDDILDEFVSESLLLGVYRGAEDDVLDRFAQVVRAEAPDVVVRITADDPLKDPAIIDQAVSLFLDDPALDYVSNTLNPSYPEGLDVEVFSAKALLQAADEAVLSIDREHVTPFIWRQPHRYKIKQFHSERDLRSWRWTLDTEQDLAFLSAVLGRLPSGTDSYSHLKVVALLDASPELFDLMPHAPRSLEKLNAQGDNVER